MLHRAVERAYNAVLLVLTLYAPKSHRLGILRSLAENLDPRLIEAWPRDTRAARRHFAQLQRAYVEARYSHAYEITPDELAWLVERVRHFHTIAAAICAEHLATIDTKNDRSEEHTSELQSLMRISYAVFCLKKKIKNTLNNTNMNYIKMNQ